MIDIEHIEPEVQLSYFQGDYYLAFKFVDIPGTVRKANISAFALNALYEAFQQGQFALVDQLAPSDKETSVTLTMGPTRGEVYATEGEL